MKAVETSLWSLIASSANKPEVGELAFIIGAKLIKDNEVRKYRVLL
jgi:hypothetical protein